MGDLSAVRWRRYGKDRVYVNHRDGARVGWMDLQTGATMLERPEFKLEFETLVAPFAELVVPTPRQPTAGPGPNPATGPAPVAPPVSRGRHVAPPVTATPTWTDLAGRDAGEATRRRAREENDRLKSQGRLRALILKAVDADTPERSWRLGADGEEAVGRRIDRLRQVGWHVLHSVPIGTRGSDIDHVLIGPTGVWTVNTKTHLTKQVRVSARSFTVDGARTDYLRNAHHEGERASRLLSTACGTPVPVRPAIVVVTSDPRSVTISRQPDDVLVADWLNVPDVFCRRPVVFTPTQAEAVFDVARRSTTWTPNPR